MTYIILAIDVDVAAGDVWAIAADLCLASVVGASASLDMSSSLGCWGAKTAGSARMMARKFFILGDDVETDERATNSSCSWHGGDIVAGEECYLGAA